MASRSILTQDFGANSAIFQSCILGYNLMVWMMLLTQEDGFNEEPHTIRMKLIHFLHPGTADRQDCCIGGTFFLSPV
jgi:hypothetical protein